MQRKDLSEAIKKRYQQIKLDATRREIWSIQVKDLLMENAKTKEDKKAVQQLLESSSNKQMRQLENMLEHLRRTDWEIPEDLKKAAEKRVLK